MRRWVFVLALGPGLLMTGCQRCVRQRPAQPVVIKPPCIAAHQPAPVSNHRPEPPAISVLPPGEPNESTPTVEPLVESAALPGTPVAAVSSGHGPDHRWLVGRLQYLHVRDVWRIRYAAPESDDRYGGTMTLVDPGAMTAFHAGQLVRVEGCVVEPESREPSPAYRVHSIHAIP